ncbi:MAG TPA: ABC transporter permease [Blastocatellia bacterium]
MDTFFHDLRYAVRQLLKKPGFAATAILTLALGIGANAAIFSVVNSVLLRRLPFKDPERLVMVWETIPSIGLSENTPAPANFLGWREESQSFESMAALGPSFTNLTGGGEPEKIDSVRVSAELFPLLGVEPLVGRWFLPEEDRPGNNRVVVISHSLWQRRFVAARDIIGKNITLNDNAYTVVGVMPAHFRIPVIESELWIPMAFGPDARTELSRNLFVLARLKSGVTHEQAQSELSAMAELWQKDSQGKFRFGINIVPLQEQLTGRIRLALIVLLAATAFVILIACANVANLLLARASARQKEVAIRIALGATRWRLARQLLTESLLLAALGGIVGLLLAAWSMSLLASAMPESLAQAKEAAIDTKVAGFTFAVSLITGVIFGLVPALQSTRPNLNETLKEGGRDSSAVARKWTRNALVISEVAMALILLVGAGLLMRSFLRLSNVDMGFRPENLLAMQIQLSSSKYRDQSKRTAFFDQLLDRVRALPGVESAAVISGLPVSWTGGGSTFILEGRAEPENTTPISNHRFISPDYFRVMGIPVVSGRSFTPQDRENSEAVAIISESLARASWPDENPLGKRISWAGDSMMTIVGVVRDVRLTVASEPKPHVYMPYTQIRIPPYELVIRAKSDPTSLASSVREEVWAIDKDQPVANIRTMEQILSASIARHRFNTILLAVFAALAIALATIGIYGVMSYTVSQSTREIGIRMALGAAQSDLMRLVIGRGLTLTLNGAAIGVAGAFALTRLMKSLLFGVTATDPITFVGVSALLILVAMLACYLPARRATRVDPMVALRYE